MKRCVFVLLALIMPILLCAQLEVKDGSFKKVEGFVNINIDKQTDDNDMPYAVLKIKTENINGKERRELGFNGDAQTFFETEYKDGEVWLYISYYATYIKIYHDDFSSTEYWFPFDMEPKCGYELTLINKSTSESTVDNIQSQTNIVNICAFSTSSSQKVFFSKGNLWYQASSNTWRFSDNQWDIVGAANSNIAQNNNDWIDLLGWGTGNNPTNKTEIRKDYTMYDDWGNNIISNGDNKEWRTLTKKEWEYVFYTRNTASGIRYVKAIVNGVNGIVLLPDNWDSSYYKLVNANLIGAAYNSNSISQSDWIVFCEINGAVFLPAGGYRCGASVKDNNISGYYWSETYKDNDCAYMLYFSNSYMNVSLNGYRDHGRCVRLVCDIEEMD